MTIIEKIKNNFIIPVLIIDNIDNAIPMIKAIVDAEIDVIEITLRTECAQQVIKEIKKEYPNLIVGASTILNLEQCLISLENGADFIVCPGYDEDVVSYCVKNNILIIPGCVTPTEIMCAKNHNVKIIKFFPANIFGGINAINTYRKIFKDILFLPTGGIDNTNILNYYKSPSVIGVAGTWICPSEDIKNKNFDKIKSLCIEAKNKIKTI